MTSWPDALVIAAIVGGIAWWVTEQTRSETQLELQRRDLEERAARRKREKGEGK